MVDYAENAPAQERTQYRKHLPELITLTPEQEENCSSVVCFVATRNLGSIALINKTDSRGRAQLAFPGGSRLAQQSPEDAARDACFDKLDVGSNLILNIYPFWTVKKKQPLGYDGKKEYTIYYCVVLDSTHILHGSAERKDNPTWHPYSELSHIYKDMFNSPHTREVLLKTGMKLKP